MTMSEVATNNGSGFDPENIARIYRGEPALVGEREVSGVLTPRVFEAASYAAEGLSYQDIADKMGHSTHTVRTQLHDAYSRLGVSKFGLVAYFPIEQDNVALEGKKLADLEVRAAGLEILESLSVGIYQKEIAQERGITASTIRTHVNNLGKIWPDARGSVRALRVANGLRARYVQAIESASGVMSPEDIAQVTLPRLVELEPAILDRYATV